MKTLLACLALALAATSASAEVTKGQKYDSYHIRIDANKPVSVKISTVYETNDGCNHFGLSGEFRKVEVPAGTQTMQQDFVAMFSVYGTEMACRPSEEVRKIPMESDAYVIEPAYGAVYATILVPAGYKLSVK